jgi:hypothetical protein
MDALDLDINNYSIHDIERFFKYNSNSKYSAVDIELREEEIRDQLLGSGHVNKRMKRDLIEFMKQAKNRLIQAKCPEIKPPTTIPKNQILDEIQYPVAPKSEAGRESNLIVKPSTQFVYTQECDYFPGIMNPLKTRVITRYLNVDTRFRKPSNQVSTDFTFQLPMKLSKVVSMQLVTFQMPYSFYGYSDVIGNNYMNLSIIYLNAGYDDSEPIQIYKTIIIPDGNYTIYQIIDTINGILSPKNPDLSLVDPNDFFSYIEFSFDIKTFKVTVKKNPTPENITILDLIIDQRKNIRGDDVYCSDISTKLGWSLGFTREMYQGSFSYVGEIVADIYNIKYIYFVIDDFNNSSNNHFINAFDESIMSPNILARISFQKSEFHLLTEGELNIITEPRKYFGPVDITRLKIKILDDRGRILDLNGADYSFCLSFKVLYDL